MRKTPRNDNLGQSKSNTLYLSRPLYKVALKLDPHEKIQIKSVRCATKPQRGAKRNFTVDEVREMRKIGIGQAKSKFKISRMVAYAIITGRNYSWIL